MGLSGPRPHQPRRILLLALPLAVALTTAFSGSPGQQDPQDPTAPFPREGTYLGKAACRDCHDDQWDAISLGHHAGAVLGEDMLGCEQCHGPGRAHGDHEDNLPRLITHPRRLVPAAQSRVCEQCHREQIAGHGGDPAGFLAAGKGCTACHEVHVARTAPAHPGLAFGRRTDSRAAEPVGAQRCVACHPLRDRLLRESHHRHLAAQADAAGCEACHGAGSLHVETGGLARLISRPDRAADGVATCRACHAAVDATEFHWRDRRKPLLSAELTCTTCHRVHEAATAAPAPPPDAPLRSLDSDTGERIGAPAVAATNALCAKCHEPALGVLEGTIHQALGGRDTPLSLGCGSCHAGAEEHARAGGRAALVDSLRDSSAAHQLQRCGSCHDSERELRHLRNGSHFRRDVTCTSCHSPAAPLGRVREDAESRCAQCHQDIAARFRQPFHHPVPEGHMGCTDCHNPHDARPKIRNLELREEACVRCHTQYRGPFVFEHQAHRLDGCVICHDPHGGSNRRMLTHPTTQANCLQCHADFPAFHDQTSGAVFTNCLNCHTEIHGSNHSRYYFR